VRVFIPTGAAGGAQAATLFRATSQSDPLATATASLTTTARDRLFLPVILND